MIVKVDTVPEMARIREGKTTGAVLTDTKKTIKAGTLLVFWMGDPRNKKSQKGSVNFGTGKVSQVQEFEIKHSIQGLQPVGELWIDGFKYSHDESYRVAVKIGFLSVVEMFKHYEYRKIGRLVTWSTVTPIS